MVQRIKFKEAVKLMTGCQSKKMSALDHDGVSVAYGYESWYPNFRLGQILFETVLILFQVF